MLGGAAIVPSDRIVTDELAWTRMTVERLQEWLTMALEAGEIDAETEIWVDSDPEGNGVHPMRAAVQLAVLHQPGPSSRLVLDEEAVEGDLPARAVWFGVGY